MLRSATKQLPRSGSDAHGACGCRNRRCPI